MDTERQVRWRYNMYYAGVYSRVSREDGDKAESDSLVNQRRLIDGFVRNKEDEITVVEYYNDDNYTGTNFNRPAFQQMYTDIQNGKINCVIVKDLSRFGRDYIEVGRYLQKEFPKLNVRFIAINDNIDSALHQYDMLMPVKNVFNEQYARDISTKVISSIRDKQKNGMFIGAFAPYGYLKDPNDKYRLIIDDYASNIIKKIFDLFNDGYGKVSISNQLNDENVLCPSEYKKSLGFKYNNANKLEQTNYWTYSTIHHILKNDVYIGNMTQHKNNKSKFNYQPTNIDKEKWITISDTHDPIIDIKTWELTQQLLKRRSRTLNLKNNVSVFAGFLVCGDCGRAMSKNTYKGGKYVSYVCGTYKRYTKGVCTSHSISEIKLINIVLEDINNILSKVRNLGEAVEQRKKQFLRKPQDYNLAYLNKLNTQLEKVRFLKKSSYEDYKMEILTKEEFFNYKKDYEEQEDKITNLIAQINNSNDSKDDSLLNNPVFEQFIKMQKIKELDRMILEIFYNKIHIHENKVIEFEYKHKGIVEEINNFI